MTGFTRFILFNVFVYIVYWLIDKVFTFFNWYSSPQLGHDWMLMPTGSDMILIFFNVTISSLVALYLLFQLKKRMDY
ncbi:MAG: hypothetical protein DSZ09_02055 [Sulfurovum sp.]|nr:MAG: hypothetical protein DSZ09_02055 [Sulfurovum sp.]RUM76041.1 MAG: hypothetical protein DSZ12_02595 [Sulfurovum sp.]